MATINKKSGVLLAVGLMAMAITSLPETAFAQRGEDRRQGDGPTNQFPNPRENARVNMGAQIGAMRDEQRARQAEVRRNGAPQMRDVGRQERPNWSSNRPDAPQRPDAGAQRPDRNDNDRGSGRGGWNGNDNRPGNDGRPGWNRDGRRDNDGRPGWNGNGRPDNNGRPGWNGDGRHDNDGRPGWNGNGRRDNDGRPGWNRDGRRDNDGRPGWNGNNGRPGWNDNRGGRNQSWNRNDWRRDNRYNWQSYRERNRSTYRIGRYYAPYNGYAYRRLNVGFSLGSMFYGNRYWINDPWSYRLPPVYGPYRWVRYYDDVLMVDTYTGEVVDVIYDFFW